MKKVLSLILKSSKLPASVIFLGVLFAELTTLIGKNPESLVYFSNWFKL